MRHRKMPKKNKKSPIWAVFFKGVTGNLLLVTRNWLLVFLTIRRGGGHWCVSRCADHPAGLSPTKIIIFAGPDMPAPLRIGELGFRPVAE